MAVRDERGRDLSRAACEKVKEAAVRANGTNLDCHAQQLGYTIGSDLYSAYLDGVVSQSMLRRLFLAHLEEPGSARTACLALVSKVKGRRSRFSKHSAFRTQH
jgi:hypothetical protein